MIRRSNKKIMKTLLIAAVLTVLMAATVYAVSGRIKMQVTRRKGDDQQVSVVFEETADHSGEQETLQEMGVGSKYELSVYDAQYSFERENPGTYIELGYWKPAAIPDGYEETFLSDRAYGAQVIRYENGNGGELRFQYAKPSGIGEVTMFGVTSEETVDINGNEGTLFRMGDSGCLFWMREVEGLAFQLSCNDPAVDLVTLARSIQTCDPYGSAEVDADTDAAITQMGDYCVTWIPDGFTERDVVGSPIPENGWYGYVRRFYTDKETNREAVFSYEPFTIPEDAETTDPVEYFLYIHREEAYADTVCEEIMVNGQTGIALANKKANTVRWLDVENGLMYEISSAALTVEELVQMAESVK